MEAQTRAGRPLSREREETVQQVEEAVGVVEGPVGARRVGVEPVEEGVVATIVVSVEVVTGGTVVMALMEVVVAGAAKEEALHVTNAISLVTSLMHVQMVDAVARRVIGITMRSSYLD